MDLTPTRDELLQRRVALLGKALFFIQLCGVSLQVAWDLSSGGVERALGPAAAWNALGTVALVGLWRLCATGHRTRRFVYVAEATALLVNAASAAMMGRYLNLALMPEFVRGLDDALVHGPAFSNFSHAVQHYVSVSIVLGGTQMFVLRAAIVPSRWWYTLALTAGAGIPMFLVTGLGLVPVEADATLRSVLPWGERWAITALMALWWAITAAVCTIISHVIYRLRTAVREAQKLGQYELVEKLGEGGMGQVFRAKHAMMRRPTAVKLLAPDAAGPTALSRFEREVQLTARLTHPNTITIFDYGRTPEGVLYYAMELLEGATLQEVVDVDGPQPAGRVLRILEMAAGALAEAHGIGLIHRDIKPANIILCEQGGIPDVVKVLDFGLVKDVHADQQTQLSREGAITGTPLYVAPETLRTPESVDGRVDIYALGAVAYFLLTGGPVFEGRSVVEVCSHHLLSAPIPPSERVRGVPEDLESLVMACLAKEPKDRPQRANEVQRRARQCRDSAAWDEARARSWWEANMPRIREARAPTEPLKLGATVAVDLAAERDRLPLA